MNSGASSDADFALSCLLDDTPAIWASFRPWLATAIEIGRIPPSQIHVHHVCPLRADVEALCRMCGVLTHLVPPIDARFPHANKIRQCVTDYGAVHRVLLTDVDTVFAQPFPLKRIHAPVAGKPVDLANPPLEMLRRIFSDAGLRAPGAIEAFFVAPDGARHRFQTLPGNFNGGLYILDRACLERLGRAWERQARWLFERANQLEIWRTNVDQISFCLAVNELGICVQQLDEAWNLPLHLPLSSGGDPILLHHHAVLDAFGQLPPSNLTRLRDAIARINRAIASFKV